MIRFPFDNSNQDVMPTVLAGNGRKTPRTT